MKYKGIQKTLNIGWGWMILLVIVFPVLGFILQLILLFVDLFVDKIIPAIPFMAFPMFLILAVYLCWSYVVAVHLNSTYLKPDKKSLKWYKVAFWNILAFNLVMALIVFLPFLFTKIGWFIDKWLYMVIELIFGVYYLSILASYIYVLICTGSVLVDLFRNKEKEKSIFEWFPYYMLVFVFPFGIPFFNKKIERYYGPMAVKGKKKIQFKPRTYDNY